MSQTIANTPTRSFLLLTAAGLALWLNFTTVQVFAAGQDNGGGGTGIDRSGKPTNAPHEHYTPQTALAKFTRLLGPDAPDFVGGDASLARMRARLNSEGLQSFTLVEEPGIGKTAYVEELGRILYAASNGRQRVYALNLDALMADTSFRGDLEARFTALMEIFAGHSDEFILFIDEAHKLMEDDKLRDSLKVYTGRPGTAVIMGTTPGEYTKSGLEGDRAHVRRAPRIPVEGNSKEKLIAILRKNRPKYEAAHGVNIDGLALDAIGRAVIGIYPNDPPLSKADDLLNGVLTMEKMSRQLGSMDLQELKTKLTYAEIELDAHRTDLSRALENTQRHAYYKAQVKLAQTEVTSLKAKFEQRRALDRMHTLNAELEELRLKMKPLQAAGTQESLTQMARIAYGQVPQIEQELESLKPAIGDVVEFRDPTISAEAVGRFVGADKGIPAGMLNDTVEEILDRVDEEMKAVHGQARAKIAVRNALKLALTRVKSRRGPKVNILFDGPPGVGKTELALAVARGVMGPNQKLVKIDMANMGEHSSMNMTGAGKGLKNAETGGVFEAVRHNPRNVVLLDEMDKAHLAALETLHPIFDTGETKDGLDRSIYFQEVIMIEAANYTGSWAYVKHLYTDNRLAEKDFGIPEGSLGSLTGDARDDKMLEMRMRRKNISESMFARLPVRIMLDGIDLEGAKEIGKLKVAEMARDITKDRKWVFEVDDAVGQFVGERGLSTTGAREITTVTEGLIGQMIADAIVALESGDKKAKLAGGYIPYGPGTHVKISMIELPATENEGITQPARRKIAIEVTDPVSTNTLYKLETPPFLAKPMVAPETTGPRAAEASIESSDEQLSLPGFDAIAPETAVATEAAPASPTRQTGQRKRSLTEKVPAKCEAEFTGQS